MQQLVTEDVIRVAVMGKIAFGNWDERLTSLTDDEFLALVKWRKGTKASESKDAKLIASLKKKLPSKDDSRLQLLTALTWADGMIEGTEHGPLYQVVMDWARSISAHKGAQKGRSRATMGKDDAHVDRVKSALENELPVSGLQPQEILSGLVLLITLADELPSGLFIKLWRFCLSSGLALSTMLDEPMGDDVPADVEVLFQAEIPWLLSLIFSDVKGSHDLAKSAKATMARSLEQGTDGDGTPHPGLLARLPFWLGSMNRILLGARLFETKLLDASQKTRLGQLLRHAISMSRSDGQIVLSQVPQTTWLSILCQTADELNWDATTPSYILLHDMARGSKSVTKGSADPKNAKGKSEAKGALPSTQTDWGKMAHLRTAWSANADLFSISYENSVPRIEFSPRGKLAFRGGWETKLVVDGKPVALNDEWGCSCWYADEEVDYLELQMNIEGSTPARINRMVFLSRDQQILIVADAVHLQNEAEVDYTSSWTSEIDFKPVTEQKTRRYSLESGNTQMHVLPMFVPLEKIEKAHGTLDYHKRTLSWSVRRRAKRMFVPILLDWNPARRGKEPEWKQLTIAEDAKPLPDHIASARLATLGKKHLIIYHSMVPGRFGRSVMGHHTHHETVIGEFQKDGTLRPLVHIETPEEE
jgi:hypothetical protein